MSGALAQILQHESRLLGYISRRIRNRARAPDILQETMLRLIEQTGKQEIANPVAYAFRVADSVIYAEARRSTVDVEALDLDLRCDLPLADEILEQKQRLKVFEDALSNLSATRRAIFIKRHVDGKSRQLIAEEMNISLEAVKKHLVRGMVELADALAAAESAALFKATPVEGRSPR